jgi:hypothetical protein
MVAILANMSNYLESMLIGHLFRGVTFPKPTVLALALCTAVPTETSTGATIAEVPNAFGYARKTFNPSTSNWGEPVDNNGSTRNSSVIAFPVASGDWGTVTSVAVCDSGDWGTGNVLFYANLTTPRVVTSGTYVSFGVGQLTIQIDG